MPDLIATLPAGEMIAADKDNEHEHVREKILKREAGAMVPVTITFFKSVIIMEFVLDIGFWPGESLTGY
ncbi:MAG: hypothetical protein E6Q62_01895 [Nitrosomonas sp.]|nr:MAG: hypothetical protein E6Q62_01895 [Nitrosomonas sp.]